MLGAGWLLAAAGAMMVSAAVAEAEPPATEPAGPALEAAPTDPRTGRLAVPWKRVTQALARNDVGEAQRLAALVPSAQWQAALTLGGPTADTATALALLPDMLGAQVWLPYLGAWILAKEPANADLVKLAVAAAGELLAQRDPMALHAWEVAEATVVDTCAALRWVAATPGRPLGSRLAAIDALAQTRGVCPPPPPSLAADSAPAIRRAAMALLPTEEPTLTVLRARMEDDVPPVAGAAAARLCQLPSTQAPDPLALKLARQLTADPKLGPGDAGPEDAVAMLECLANSADPADRALLEGLTRRGAPPVRVRALELLGRPAAR